MRSRVGLANYVSNELNQYDRADASGAAPLRQGMRYDEDGNLVEQYVAADMNCDGTLDISDINPFIEAMDCAYDPNDPNAVCCEACWDPNHPNCPFLNADINGDGLVTWDDLNAFITLLSGGNGAHGVQSLLTWDAENRLVRVEPAREYLHLGDLKVEFVYDYLGRRIEKRVYDVPDIQPLHWDLVEVRRFVWSGWLVLMELDGLHNNQVLKKYTWGLDLAALNGGPTSGRSMLESAGGIGGLLALEDLQDPNDPNDNLNYVYLYDASGNVGQLVDWSHDPNDPNAADAAIVARYEYDPYGNVTAASGSYATANPFRWSTKYWDDETGFGYWGRRYYDAALGRWLSRDPLDELGGVNLYAYAGNDPADRYDPLGEMFVPCPWWQTDPSRCRDNGQNDANRCHKKAEPPSRPPTEEEICEDRCANTTGQDHVDCVNQCMRQGFIGPRQPDPPPRPECARFERLKHLYDGYCDRKLANDQDACMNINSDASAAVASNVTTCVAGCRRARNPYFGQVSACIAACYAGAGVVEGWNYTWFLACLLDSELSHLICNSNVNGILNEAEERCHRQ